MTIKSASNALSREVHRHLREQGSGTSVEADEALNNASRKLVAAMAEQHGDVWLGNINLYGEDRRKAEKVLWKWDGSTVLNFSAAFVVPAFDAELLKLILDRDSAPYTGTKDDSVRIDAIHARIEALGGYCLVWS